MAMSNEQTQRLVIQSLCELLLAEAPTVDEHGNRVHRLFRPSSRYTVDFADDFHRYGGGWKQFDTEQDADYFGVWLCPGFRWSLSYCEGDWTLVTCPGKNSYNAEVRAAMEFYGEGFIAIAIDPDAGTSTRFVQDRSEFLL